MRLTRRQRWRQVILPAIFPAYVTGGITAAGGAWNASIVAEVVAWHHHTLKRTGSATTSPRPQRGELRPPDRRRHRHEFFVVAVNRLFWRRLYRLAETRFSL